MAELSPKPTDDVLCVGFGFGFGACHLAGVVTEGHVTGIDPSEVMLRMAAKPNRKRIARDA